MKIVIHPSDFNGKDAFAEFEKSPGGTLIVWGAYGQEPEGFQPFLKLEPTQCHPVPQIKKCHLLHVNLAISYSTFMLYAHVVQIGVVQMFDHSYFFNR